MPLSQTSVMIPVATVARAPELRTVGAKQTPKCEFLVAVDRGYGRDKGTDWFSITAWGRTAEIAAQQLTKGWRVNINGHLRGDFYEAKDGGGTRRSCEIVADAITFLQRPRVQSDQDLPSRQVERPRVVEKAR